MYPAHRPKLFHSNQSITPNAAPSSLARFLSVEWKRTPPASAAGRNAEIERDRSRRATAWREGHTPLTVGRGQLHFNRGWQRHGMSAQFRSPCEEYFASSSLRGGKIDSVEARREPRCRTCPAESIIAIAAPRSRRSAGCKERTESMLPPQKTRDLALSLIACEADATKISLHTEPATVRVYERLRRQLSAPVGADGFQALASRALALAKSQSPRLSAVQVTANGDLRGLGEVESQTGADEDGEAGSILIAQLLGLFLTFLGEATTLRLMEDLRLQVDASREPATTTEDTTASAADGPVMTAAFEDLLLEIDRLRDVSEHIETLADRHPGMENGLVSVAGNILNIASVLDVFTLIRSKAGGSQEDAPGPQTNGYVN